MEEDSLFKKSKKLVLPPNSQELLVLLLTGEDRILQKNPFNKMFKDLLNTRVA
jgi:hypothetical protein